MTWELHLRHHDRHGSLKNGYIAPLVCRYANSLDSDEPLVFSLNMVTYAEYEAIAEYDIIEVMVRNLFLGIKSAAGGFVRDFVGIVRGQPNMATDNDGITTLSWTAPEQKHLLGWRRILWPAGTVNRSTFTASPAETIVKTLVEYNCTASASIANGRWRSGDLSGMSVALDIEADGARGDAVSLSFAGGWLLSSLAKVCESGGAYYSLVWQGGSLGGSHEWSLTWGRGADKTSGGGRVLLSMNTNTLRQPRRTYRYATGTVALSAGQGEGAARAVTVVQGNDYAADNDIESFVDARNETIEAGRIGAAQSVLLEYEEQSNFDSGIIQTSSVCDPLFSYPMNGAPLAYFR